MQEITFTFDLEDHRKYKNNNLSNIEKNCYQILNWLNNKSIKGTFFVVGDTAKKLSNLVKFIYQNGHEVASHGLDHTHLVNLNKRKFFEDVYKSKSILEDLIGNNIIGYRAPFFSLYPETKWAIEILTELKFKYSSSIIPKNSFTKSFPGVSQKPFLWNSELIELPMVLGNILNLKFPTIGGIYFRYIPVTITNAAIKNDYLLWTYMHAYDFDKDEKFCLIHGTSYIGSFLLWCNRRNTYRKLNYFLENYKTETFKNRIKKLNKKEMYLYK